MMKLKNTTDWPDWMLRRMVSWCCRQIKLPARDVRRAEFGKRRAGAYNGLAWSGGRIRVVVGPASSFPVKPYLYPGRKREAFMSPAIADQVEALVAVTAHELAHIRRFVETRYSLVRRQHGERHTRFEERRVLELFRAEREALLAVWSAPPAARPAKPKPTRAERNEAKARSLLAVWERKAKLAKTKVAHYRRKVRRYDRMAASRAI